MKIITALVAVAMSGAAAQAGSIRTFDADSASFPSLLRVGTAEAPKADEMKAEAETAMPMPPAVDADGNELDGRSQLEAWAAANGTTVSDLLTKRLYGHYPKNTDGEIAALAPKKVEKPAEDAATDEQKTASVTADENAPEADAPVAADAGSVPVFPEGELRKPE